MKKQFSILLALCMVLGLFGIVTVISFADETTLHISDFSNLEAGGWGNTGVTRTEDTETGSLFINFLKVTDNFTTSFRSKNDYLGGDSFAASPTTINHKYAYFTLRAAKEGSIFVSVDSFTSANAEYRREGRANLDPAGELVIRVDLTEASGNKFRRFCVGYPTPEQDVYVTGIWLSDDPNLAPESGRNVTLPSYKIEGYKDRSAPEDSASRTFYMNTDGSFAFAGKAGTVSVESDPAINASGYNFIYFQVAKKTQTDIGELPESIQLLNGDGQSVVESVWHNNSTGATASWTSGTFASVWGSPVTITDGKVWTNAHGTSGYYNIRIKLKKDGTNLTNLYFKISVEGCAPREFSKINGAWLANDYPASFIVPAYTADKGVKREIISAKTLDAFQLTFPANQTYTASNGSKIQISADGKSINILQGSGGGLEVTPNNLAGNILENYNYIYMDIENPGNGEVVSKPHRLVLNGTKTGYTGDLYYLCGTGSWNGQTGKGYGLNKLDISGIRITSLRFNVVMDAMSGGTGRINGIWLSNSPSFVAAAPVDTYQALINRSLEEDGVKAEQSLDGSMTFTTLTNNGNCSFSIDELEKLNITKTANLYLNVGSGIGNVSKINIVAWNENSAIEEEYSLYAPTGTAVTNQLINGSNIIDITGLPDKFKIIKKLKIYLTSGVFKIDAMIFTKDTPDKFEMEYWLNSGGPLLEHKLSGFTEIGVTEIIETENTTIIKDAYEAVAETVLYPQGESNMEAVYMKVNSLTSATSGVPGELSVAFYTYGSSGGDEVKVICAIREDMIGKWVRLDVKGFGLDSYTTIKFVLTEGGEAEIDNTIYIGALMPYTFLDENWLESTKVDYGPNETKVNSNERTPFEDAYPTNAVLKDKDGKVIPNVTVIINETSEYKTDKEGKFAIKALNIGEQKAVVKSTGGEILYVYFFTITDDSNAVGANTFLYSKIYNGQLELKMGNQEPK